MVNQSVMENIRDENKIAIDMKILVKLAVTVLSYFNFSVTFSCMIPGSGMVNFRCVYI